MLTIMDMRSFSKTFFKGLIAIIPLVLTLYLLIWLASAAEYALGNIFKFFFPDSWYLKGMGFALGLAVVFFFGKFLDSRPFRQLFNLFEELLLQIPVVKNIYTAIRDLASMFSTEQSKKLEHVVLVKMPNENKQQIGFVTVTDFDEISPQGFIADGNVAVFLPFSYQMGGTTVIVPRGDIQEIDLSIEDALRFIATAGIVGTAGKQDKAGRLGGE